MLVLRFTPTGKEQESLELQKHGSWLSRRCRVKRFTILGLRRTSRAFGCRGVIEMYVQSYIQSKCPTAPSPCPLQCHLISQMGNPALSGQSAEMFSQAHFVFCISHQEGTAVTFYRYALFFDVDWVQPLASEISTCLSVLIRQLLGSPVLTSQPRLSLQTKHLSCTMVISSKVGDLYHIQDHLSTRKCCPASCSSMGEVVNFFFNEWPRHALTGTADRASKSLFQGGKAIRNSGPPWTCESECQRNMVVELVFCMHGGHSSSDNDFLPGTVAPYIVMRQSFLIRVSQRGINWISEQTLDILCVPWFLKTVWPRQIVRDPYPTHHL